MAKETVTHKKLKSPFMIFLQRNRRMLIEAVVVLVLTGVSGLSGAVIGACISSYIMPLIVAIIALSTAAIVATLVGGTISGPFAPLVFIAFFIGAGIGAGLVLGIGAGIGAGIGVGAGGLSGLFMVGVERLLVGGMESRIFGTGLNVLVGGNVGALVGAFFGNILLPGAGIPIGGLVGSLVGTTCALTISLFTGISLELISSAIKTYKEKPGSKQFNEENIKIDNIYSNELFKNSNKENNVTLVNNITGQSHSLLGHRTSRKNEILPNQCKGLMPCF